MSVFYLEEINVIHIEINVFHIEINVLSKCILYGGNNFFYTEEINAFYTEKIIVFYTEEINVFLRRK